jgi:hypothetical protein
MQRQEGCVGGGEVSDEVETPTVRQQRTLVDVATGECFCCRCC